MLKKEDTYLIGRITKAHGLKGEAVFNFEDDIFDRVDCPYLICEVDGILVPFFFEEYRFRSEWSALVKFEDIDSVEQLQPIIGSNVWFEKKYVDVEDHEELSLYFFIGFSIVDADHHCVGKITGIDAQTDNWLFEVESDGRQTLIPAHEDLMNIIDYNNKTIEMDLPAGLLDL